MINFKKKNLKIKAPENRNMKARSRFEIDVVQIINVCWAKGLYAG
jgi:hypothetical protein